MEREELQNLLRRNPFEPFRVVVDDGRTYEVRHPRMTLLAHSFIKIGIQAPDLRPPISDHTEFVRLSQIVRVEPLSSPDNSVSS